MKLFAAIAALAFSAGAASATTVDFSGFDHGDLIADGAFDFGNGLTGTIATSGGSGNAQIFNTAGTNAETVQDKDLRFHNAGLGNVLIINEDEGRVDDNARGGTITFMFDRLVRFIGVNLVDIEESQAVTIRADNNYSSGAQFNADNEYSFFAPGSVVETQTLTFRFGGSGAIDNLTISEVPLPMSGLLLLGGLGALGLQRRKKV